MAYHSPMLGIYECDYCGKLKRRVAKVFFDDVCYVSPREWKWHGKFILCEDCDSKFGEFLASRKEATCTQSR